MAGNTKRKMEMIFKVAPKHGRTTESYADMFHTDPAICIEELTPEVLEEIGRLKYGICEAVVPHWKAITGDIDYGALGLELEPMSPDFVRALAAALKVTAN
jgi:hypothetical protein